MTFIAEKDAAFILPAIQKDIAAINCSTTTQVIDLCTLPGSPLKSGGDPASQNPIGHFIRITADPLGNPIYYATGNNFATLNAIANTVTYSTVNTTTGAVTLSATGQEVDVIAAGSWEDFVIPQTGTAQTQSPPGAKSICRYVALLTASGNGVARVRQSGP